MKLIDGVPTGVCCKKNIIYLSKFSYLECKSSRLSPATTYTMTTDTGRHPKARNAAGLSVSDSNEDKQLKFTFIPLFT